MEKWITTPIGELYTRFRQGQRVAVFLSGQGYFSTADNFALLIESLPASWGYLAIDYPNVGRSSLKDQTGMRLDDWTASLSQILQDYEVTDYLICAHSIGGVLAKKLIVAYPRSCLGFIGVEPTTFSILRGELSQNLYPQVQALHQKLLHKPDTILVYLEQLLARFHSEKQGQIILEQYQKNEARLASCPVDFVWVIDLINADFQPHLPMNLPSIIISQDFREKEYKESEYWTGHPQSQLLLCGDNHYLHWTEAAAIRQAIDALLQ